jgi:hypothetical protein
MAPQSGHVPDLPEKWEEVELAEDNEEKIDQALGLLRRTLPGRWNYDEMTKEMIMHKMVKRKNSNGDSIRGLRIFQRIIPVSGGGAAVPPIDIAVFFFVRMREKNPRLRDDAYCMTVGVDASVSPAALYQDVWGVCKHLNPQSGVATIEIVSALDLPDELPSGGGGAVLRQAFVSALAPLNVPPQPGQIYNPPDDIRPGRAWPRNMKSWRLRIS